VRLTVHDVLGRRVEERLLGVMAAGTHQLAWPFPPTLPSGRLWLTLEQDGHPVAVEPLTRIR